MAADRNAYTPRKHYCLALMRDTPPAGRPSFGFELSQLAAPYFPGEIPTPPPHHRRRRLCDMPPWRTADVSRAFDEPHADIKCLRTGRFLS